MPITFVCRRPTAGMPTELPRSEFDDRLAAVRERVAEAEVDAGVWFGATGVDLGLGGPLADRRESVVELRA